MNNRNILALASMIALSTIFFSISSSAEENGAVNIKINTEKNRKYISPYIYGINSELMYNDVSVGSIRAGGNRYTAYNWENNFSNAGSDWKHISDTYFQQNVSANEKNLYGFPAINLSRQCAEKNNAYSIMTLQLAGYVAADDDGEVSESETAPSARWDKVELVKGSDFSLEPDTTDGIVYMDEFVNYLVNTLGDSSSKTGIKAYSLDNEPALWNGTHPRVHPEQTTCAEIVEKSVTMAKAVKKIDSGAEIFGPALYGFNAYTTFQGAPDWNNIQLENEEYRWFIDYYLDEMKKAEDECGTRLLDVLDVHFYTEAKGPCGERSCNHYSDKGCVEARMNSTRTLWDETYREDSWIADSGTDLIPILPNLKKSIEEFYPGTEIAITEYNFGGDFNVCGAIAEADALGIFAENEVYCANLFAGNAPYQLAAINLYTNYDEQGNGFGDTLVSCESDDSETACYASIDGDDQDVIKLVVMNKSFDKAHTVNISFENNNNYSYVHSYGIVPEFSQVFDFTDNNEKITVDQDIITYKMDPQTATMLVIAKDKEAFEKNAAKPAQNIADESSYTSKSNNVRKFIKLSAVCTSVISLASVSIILFIKKRAKKYRKDN